MTFDRQATILRLRVAIAALEHGDTEAAQARTAGALVDLVSHRRGYPVEVRFVAVELVRDDDGTVQS
jgi:hypothetical protein